MRVTTTDIDRPKKGEISLALRDLLTTRQTTAPEETALYAYIPLFDDLATRLASSVEGSAAAKAARAVRLTKLAIADDEVDRWYRHCCNYLEAESLRRTGDMGAVALALYARAFPDGLAKINVRIDEENKFLHGVVTLLRNAESAPILASLGFPTAFLDKLDAALTASDAAFGVVAKARDLTTEHAADGRDAEDEFVEVMVRYRKYIGSRATKRGNLAVYNEGLALLAPLLDELSRLQAEKQSEETRAKNEALAKAKAEAEKVAEKAAEDADKKPPTGGGATPPVPPTP